GRARPPSGRGAPPHPAHALRTMALGWLLPCVLGSMALAYRLGAKRALALARGAPRGLHSLPEHHGLWLALWCGIPAFAALALWAAVERPLLQLLLRAARPELLGASDGPHGGLMDEIARAAAAGHAADVSPAVHEAAARLAEL